MSTVNIALTPSVSDDMAWYWPKNRGYGKMLMHVWVLFAVVAFSLTIASVNYMDPVARGLLVIRESWSDYPINMVFDCDRTPSWGWSLKLGIQYGRHTLSKWRGRRLCQIQDWRVNSQAKHRTFVTGSSACPEGLRNCGSFGCLSTCEILSSMKILHDSSGAAPFTQKDSTGVARNYSFEYGYNVSSDSTVTPLSFLAINVQPSGSTSSMCLGMGVSSDAAYVEHCDRPDWRYTPVDSYNDSSAAFEEFLLENGVPVSEISPRDRTLVPTLYQFQEVRWSQEYCGTSLKEFHDATVKAMSYHAWTVTVTVFTSLSSALAVYWILGEWRLVDEPKSRAGPVLVWFLALVTMALSWGSLGSNVANVRPLRRALDGEMACTDGTTLSVLYDYVKGSDSFVGMLATVACLNTYPILLLISDNVIKRWRRT